MRWLGIAAAFGAILAAVMNTIWFTRHGISFGAFLSVVAGPALLGTAGFMAFTLLLGFVTVRLMLRRDEEGQQTDGQRKATKELTVPEESVTQQSK